MFDSGWTYEQAKQMPLAMRLSERCRTFAGGETCWEARKPKDKWCERCLANDHIRELKEALNEATYARDLGHEELSSEVNRLTQENIELSQDVFRYRWAWISACRRADMFATLKRERDALRNQLQWFGKDVRNDISD